MQADRRAWVLALTRVADDAYSLADDELVATSSVIENILLLLHIPERATPLSIPSFVVAQVLAGQYPSKKSSTRSETFYGTIITPPVWGDAITSQIKQSWPDITEAEQRRSVELFTELFVTLGAAAAPAVMLPEFLLG